MDYITSDLVLISSTLVYMSDYSGNDLILLMKSEMSFITSASPVNSSFLIIINSKVLCVTKSIFMENKVSSRQLKSFSKPAFSRISFSADGWILQCSLHNQITSLHLFYNLCEECISPL